MGMTLAEKILARASGRETVAPDQIVVAAVDLAMSHENADLVRKSFLDVGVARVWDAERIVIILDHRVPAESEKTATTHKAIREFVHQQGLRHFYDVGRGGICHQVLAEQGHVLPGMVVVGTDSHTTTHGAFGAFATGIGATEMAGVWIEGRLWFKVPATLRIEVEGDFAPWISAKDLILNLIGRLGADGADYRAVEFDGSLIRGLTVASRMVLANLSMEMGAKVAFTPVDYVLLDYLSERTARKIPMTTTSRSCASTPRPSSSRRWPARTPWTTSCRSPSLARCRSTRRCWEAAPTDVSRTSRWRPAS
jgi:3-isopropylmalate/(R)-2-methylmalate dehydratase large subunit